MMLIWNPEHLEPQVMIYFLAYLYLFIYKIHTKDGDSASVYCLGIMRIASIVEFLWFFTF